MSIGMSLLAILDEGPSYGLRLKLQFEARTGGVWPLNVGQVYTTLDRLERDGLVRQVAGASVETQKAREITDAGRVRLRSWFERPQDEDPPARDETVLKLVMAVRHTSVNAEDVIQAERRGAVELLREFTKLKRDAPADADLGWALLIESLIFKTEARVRWLDACEARLRRSSATSVAPAPAVVPADPREPSEVIP